MKQKALGLKLRSLYWLIKEIPISQWRTNYSYINASRFDHITFSCGEPRQIQTWKSSKIPI